TKVIVDSVDIHFVRAARKVIATPAGQRGCGVFDANFSNDLTRELNVYAAADAILTASQKEADLVGDLIPKPGLAHWVQDMERPSVHPSPLNRRRGILFLGSFRHQPNLDGVEFLCKEVAPRLDLRLLERHPIYIIGDHLNDRVRGFARGLPHVRMVGWV